MLLLKLLLLLLLLLLLVLLYVQYLNTGTTEFFSNFVNLPVFYMKENELTLILLFTTPTGWVLRGRNKGPVLAASRTFFSSHPIPCPLGGKSPHPDLSGQRRRPGCRMKSLFTAPIDKGRGDERKEQNRGERSMCGGKKCLFTFHRPSSILGKTASVRPRSGLRPRNETRSTGSEREVRIRIYYRGLQKKNEHALKSSQRCCKYF